MKVNRTEAYRHLFLVLILIVSAIGTLGFNQALAWETHYRDENHTDTTNGYYDENGGIVIDKGQYDGNKYVMEAKGQEYNYYKENGGDWQCKDLGHAIRLSDAKVAYFFKVPQELYDHRLIKWISIEIKYDGTDYGDSKYGNEDRPPKFYVRDFRNAEYDEKGEFLNNIANNDYHYKSTTLYDVYTDQSQYRIGSPDGNSPYEIHVRIYAPDGYGSAPDDDDAEIDIDYVRVYLHLSQQHPPQLRLVSPEMGPNQKVNVPLGDESRSFTIEADDLSGSGYPYREYYWTDPENIPLATNPKPSFSDLTCETTEPNMSYTFNKSASDYVIYCYVLYKKNSSSTKMKETIISEMLEIPVRVWQRPTVSDAPPQDVIDSGDVFWYNGKYIGVAGQPVRLMANGEAKNSVDEIDKFIWSFDNTELEQGRDEVVSYTWNSAQSYQLKCKAVTNYGIESEEKTFTVAVYPIPQLDPGGINGQYSGRTNKPIRLKGNLTNTTSYPGASVEYRWRVNGDIPIPQLKGDAVDEGDYIRLTEAQNGQVEYVNMPMSDDFSVTGEFWSGGGSHADAFYVYLWATGTPTSENDAKGQYTIAFDERDEQIQLLDNGSRLKTVDLTKPLDNAQWRPFRIVFKQGKFQVYMDHKLKLEYDVGDAYQSRMNDSTHNLFGFGARTENLNNEHRVRNMMWTPGEPIDTTGNGEAEYTWTEEGTHKAAFTVTVTTPEGLILEKTGFVDVKIESGVPTAMPGGPYRGGIQGGNYSPIQFEGNDPDFVEADDIGHIKDWTWFFPDNGGCSLKLNGGNDHVELNSFSDFPTNAITVEFWMRSSDKAKKGTPISYGSADDLLIYDYGDLKFRIAGEQVTPSDSSTKVPVNDGRWHHIAITWQSSDGQFKLYEDGAEVKDYSVTVARDETLTQGGTLIVGQPQGSFGEAFVGFIDEVMIWNVVRTGDEIRSDMDGELIGNESGLVLYWKFDEGEGDTVNDETGQGHNGSLLNTADAWASEGHPVVVHGIWNPTYEFPEPGNYEVGLKVRSEYGKWSTMAVTRVKAISGKIAGYVRAADLRTPVKGVRLTLTSSHVDENALIRAANSDDRMHVGSGCIWTETDDKGYYEFTHLPLGSYRIRASKGEGDKAHEFKKAVQVVELTLDLPNQLAVDFVDLSVFSVGGRIVYSIKKNEADVLVSGVKVTAQPVGSTSLIRSLPSTKSLSSPANTNYSLPLFAGKYLFLAEKEGHDIRLAGTNSDDTTHTPPDGYDPDTGLITIDRARTDIDFVDYTTRELTVIVQDSGGNPIAKYPDNFSNAGDPIKVTVEGTNGAVNDEPVVQEGDELGTLKLTLNPGKYTVYIKGAKPERKEVDLTGEDGKVTMIIPVRIELAVYPDPKLFDVESQKFLELFGLTENDNPEGYMYYYPPKPRSHTYTIEATANGHPVKNFVLHVTDNVSMMTPDEAEEQRIEVVTDYKPEGDQGKTEYTIIAGLPKQTDDDPPLAAPKTVTFWAEAEGYEDSDTVTKEVTVLGVVSKGGAAKIVSVPVVNYTVLHDPPGDHSYSFLDDTMTVKGIITDMRIKIKDKEIPVYPLPWSDERSIEGFKFEKSPDSESEFKDLKDKGLLSYEEPDSVQHKFIIGAAYAGVTGSTLVFSGPLSYLLLLAKIGVTAWGFKRGDTIPGFGHFVQYEITPNRQLRTPSDDTLPDLVGPGKGDIYFGEGWTLGLQTKYFMGIRWNKNERKWELSTEEVKTYDILDVSNQYIYTIRDIENIIDDLQRTINDIGDDPDRQEEKKKLQNAYNTWNTLLENNLAYIWNRDYVPYLHDPDESKRKTFDDFAKDHNLKDMDMLIFSAGPAFEYSRKIQAGDFSYYSIDTSVGSSTSISNSSIVSAGANFFGSGAFIEFALTSSAGLTTTHTLGRNWEGGKGTEQKVGFVLQDDDVGDNLAVRVGADPRWGTPIFFQDPGSYTSDPWEAGTNKAVDFTMELVQNTADTFDYHEGAHYKVKLTYTGQRSLENNGYINFIMYERLNDGEEDNPTVRFNGDMAPYRVKLTKQGSIAYVNVSVYPPEADKDNSGEKQYTVRIIAEEEGDQHINRSVTLYPKFADLRAPRAVVVAPYDGERISPEFFPSDNPFKIEVVSEDMDIAKIQLQIRSKRPDGVWEEWCDLSGMEWEEEKDNSNVTVFDRLDRRPPRREFTFRWPEDQIRNLGVGEYALRAVAEDKASNKDLDPPFVTFMVDDAKPSVLCTVPDYQARDSERIYHGELSVTFTDDMRATDFSDRTFYVTDLLDGGKMVSGYVSYSPALRKAVFVPITPFKPNGFYRVEIKTDVHDLAGNPLDNTFIWTFRTTDAPFEPTWSLNWRVTDGVTTDSNNIAGVEYGATDGKDEKDVRAVPALTSTSQSPISLSFLIDGDKKNGFDRDIRPADGRLAHHWFFVIDNAKQGATVTLEYQPSVRLTKTTRQYQILRLVEFDQQGNVSNVITLDPTQAPTDSVTGEIGYVVAYQYTNQGESSRYFRLDVQKAEYVATEWEKGTSGWKFFSVPITPQRAEPFVNLGDDIDPFQMFQYDTQSGGYKVYPYDIGEVALQTGHGYFTRLAEDVEVDVGGAMNQGDVTLTLQSPGWHPIGNPFIKPVKVSDLKINGEPFDNAVSDGIVEGTLYRWKIVTEEEKGTKKQAGIEVSDEYQTVSSDDTLEPWEGYWLKTNQADVTLTIPAPADLPDRAPTPDYLKPPMAPM
ncbi:Ig-like domain-containing protein, partial [Candidatus Poribacteria bacterium]|nr:Ig-like domain-containing protein [Candidatus Poribacteria bacterium]